MARSAVQLTEATGAANPVDVVPDVVRAAVVPLAEATDVAVSDIAGRTLAHDLVARTPVPTFEHSAVDGVAIRGAPVPAGFPSFQPRVVPVMADEPIPALADRVAARERCLLTGGKVMAPAGLKAGANIRRVGEDVALGALLARAGARLDARHAALFTAAGHRIVPCLRPIRVALLLVTGGGIQIASAASGNAIQEPVLPMLHALLATAGDLEVSEVASPPSPRALSRLLGRLAGEVDLIVAIGATSQNRDDLVRRNCLQLGGTMVVEAIAMRPGRPVRLAQLGSTSLLCLPGSPFAALVGFLVLARPIIARLRDHEPTLPEDPARAGFFLDGPRHRAEFFPARIDGSDGTGVPVFGRLARAAARDRRP
jgi:molybdopterin molybdotransferase